MYLVDYNIYDMYWLIINGCLKEFLFFLVFVVKMFVIFNKGYYIYFLVLINSYKCG